MSITHDEYEAMANEAMRGVVKLALERQPKSVSDGHFSEIYITFDIEAHGVAVPAGVPRPADGRLSIVLQHQFWNLDVGDDGFAVTLSFGGRHMRLAVPYSAMLRYYDPEAGFLLEWTPHTEAETSPTPPAGTVVSLDSFKRGLS